MDTRTEAEKQSDEYYKLKDEAAILEDKMKTFESMEHTITQKDLEAFLKNVCR